MVIGLGIIQQILAKLAARTRRKSGEGRRREQKLGKIYSNNTGVKLDKIIFKITKILTFKITQW